MVDRAPRALRVSIFPSSFAAFLLSCRLMQPAPSWLSELTALLGPDCVSTTQGDLATHSMDKWFASHAPEVVVFAKSTDQVSALMRFASQRSIPVTPRGAGVGYVGGCVPMEGGIALS